MTGSRILLALCLSVLLTMTQACTGGGGGGSKAGGTTNGSNGTGGSGGSGGSGGGSGGSGGPGDPGGSGSTTLSNETRNNTSASDMFVNKYYNYTTNSVSTSGDIVPGNVSQLDVHSLLPAGAGTRVYAETQTWFCHNTSNEAGGSLVSAPSNNPGSPNAPKCGSHIDIGYNSDDVAHIDKQIQDMVNRGVDGVLMDWTGNRDTINNRSISRFVTEASTRNSKSNGVFQVGVLEDEAIKYCADGTFPCLPCTSFPNKSNCNVTSQIISDINWVVDNLASQQSYMKSNGRPIIAFFSPDYYAKSHGTSIDWNAVRSQSHGNPLLLFEGDNFNHAQADGAFHWVGPSPFVNCTDAATCFQNALNNLAGWDYNGTQQPSSKYIMSSAWKGFDDAITDAWHYSASDHATRYVDQACGLTWLNTFKTNAGKFPVGGRALNAVQLITWDDYEEATELETGIDNCTSGPALSVSGTNLNWTISFGSSIKGFRGSEETIDHYEVFYTYDTISSNPSLSHLTDVGVTGAGRYSLNLASYSFNTTPLRFYVKAVGKPFIHNHMSNGVIYPSGQSTGSGSSGSGSSGSGSSGSGGSGGSGSGSGSGSGTPAVVFTSPADNTNVSSPVHVVADVTPSTDIQTMILYVDGMQFGKVVQGPHMDYSVPLAAGMHNLTVNSWNSKGTVFSSAVTVGVK